MDRISKTVLSVLTDVSCTHYFLRMRPRMLGVFGIMMQARQVYFRPGTPLHGECQLSWLEHGDEEWVVISVKEQFADIIVGLAQATGMEIYANPPFELPDGIAKSILTVWRSGEADPKAIEEEDDQFLELFKH